ncbi:hypothetical protein LPJ69_000503 [Coemansia sp. RSA 1752]|nr:hypothetical protein LPJ69_000503 [Coemansia sp. RSA 1752]
MAKSKILIKAAAKPANDDLPARPRTAAGDRGLLRRFRLGRILFGAGSDEDSTGHRGSQHLVRTNSVQTPAPDVPHMPGQPLPAYGSPHEIHALSLRPRPSMRAGAESSTDARKSQYSMMSRRSSAPDVAELARRLSRHIEEDLPEFSSTHADAPTPEYASTHADTPTPASILSQPSPPQPGSVLPPHMRKELDDVGSDNASGLWQEQQQRHQQQQHRADINHTYPCANESARADAIEQDDCVFIPLSSTAHTWPSPVLVSASVQYDCEPKVAERAASSDLHSAAAPPTPDMTRATLIWREPRPASLISQSTSKSSPSLVDSLLQAGSMCEREPLPDGLSDAVVPLETAGTRHSSEPSATQLQSSPLEFPSLESPSLRSPPLESMSLSTPLVQSPHSEPPAQPLPETPQFARPHRSSNGSAPVDDERYFPLRRPKPSDSDCWLRGHQPQLRPKSLYERSSCKALGVLHSRDDEFSPSQPSSSIASAKAFLMMIASGDPHGDSASASNHLSIVTSGVDGVVSSPVSVPASAPLAGSASSQTFEQQLACSDCSTMVGGHELLLDALGPAGRSTSPSTSPGAAGNRSLRARSKLAGAGIRRASTYVWGRSSVFIKALSSADELPGSGLPQLQQQPGPGAWESDMDTGSTKTDDAASIQGPAPPHASLAAHQETAPDPVPRPVTSPRSSKKSPAAMRLHAARELVMTEKNFVDNLFVIKKVWMEPVFSSANSPKPIIPYQTARVIFFGVAALHAHASHFYREMDYALGSYERSQGPVEGREDDGMRIGALFRANDRHWNDFIAYVRNYGAAVGCLKQLQDYKPYLRYHEECMLQKRTNRQSLKDLLMLPIQRITRYTLLLKNVLKHTPAVHSDHIELCRAVKNVTHFATIVNECRRKQEEMQRVAEMTRSVEGCPPFPHVEIRSFVAEFFVRELISRLPTRLLLFSDMLVVAQATSQVVIDDAGSADADWTYYGYASLDDVEVQNADESTNTLITILSLNRYPAPSDISSASRPSLPLGSEPSVNMNSASEQRSQAHGSPYCSTNASEAADAWARSGSSGQQTVTSSYSETALADYGANKKKKTKGRRGLLHAGSRESIPDHIAALSHSTFPSPVPPPTQVERSQSRLYSPSPGPSGDHIPDRDSHMQSTQRPKTASGRHGASFSAATVYSSNSTLGIHGGSVLPGDLTGSFRAQHLDHHYVPPSSTQTLAASRSDVAPPRPPQLTLVMQHATSAARKQFVRALKDATTTLTNEALSFGDSDTSCQPFGDSSSEVLNLHPL